MHPDKVDKLNGYGVIWRIIQPFILGGYLTLIMVNLNQMKENFNEKCLVINRDITEIKTDFKEHQRWGQDIISYYQNEWTDIKTRVTRMEVRLNGVKKSDIP